MALALYRKYRPRTFAEVIGQEHVTEPLSQALRSGRLHHAYLFSGPRGCGKTSQRPHPGPLAQLRAGADAGAVRRCASPASRWPTTAPARSTSSRSTRPATVVSTTPVSCGSGRSSRRPAAASRSTSSTRRTWSRRPGFNALLKLVEEPPDYVKFIFATTEPEKVLGTIKSRTHHYPFRLIPPGGAPAVPGAALPRPRASRSSRRCSRWWCGPAAAAPGTSLSVLDQLIAGAGPEGVSYARAVALLGVTDVALIDEMCDALAAGDGAAAYATIDRVAEAGHDPRRFASDLLERLRDLIVLQQVPDAATKGLIDGPADQLERMAAQAQRLGPATLSRCADIVHNGLVEMRGTTAPRLLLELITRPHAAAGRGRLERRAAAAAGAHGAAAHAIAGRRAASASSAAPRRAEPPTPHRGPPRSSAAGAAATAATAPRRAATAPPRGRRSTRRDRQQPAAAQSSAARRQPAGAARVGPAPAAAAGRAERAELRADAAPRREPAPRARRIAGARRAAHRDRDRREPSAGRADAPSRRPQPRRRRSWPTRPRPSRSAPAAAPPARSTPPACAGCGTRSSPWSASSNKRIAALAREATVRDLDGDTLVLTFQYPVHATMLSEQAAAAHRRALRGARRPVADPLRGGRRPAPAAAPPERRRGRPAPGRPAAGQASSRPRQTRRRRTGRAPATQTTGRSRPRRVAAPQTPAGRSSRQRAGGAAGGGRRASPTDWRRLAPRPPRAEAPVPAARRRGRRRRGRASRPTTRSTTARRHAAVAAAPTAAVRVRGLRPRRRAARRGGRRADRPAEQRAAGHAAAAADASARRRSARSEPDACGPRCGRAPTTLT